MATQTLAHALAGAVQLQGSPQRASRDDATESGKAPWRIHEVAFRKLSKPAVETSKDRDCAICFQPIQAMAVALPCTARGCQSFFHGVCIRQWLVRNPNCPLCRGDLKELVTPLGAPRPEKGAHPTVPTGNAQRQSPAGSSSGGRWPLAEFWLVELEEEASPWLRREGVREGQHPARDSEPSQGTRGVSAEGLGRSRDRSRRLRNSASAPELAPPVALRPPPQPPVDWRISSSSASGLRSSRGAAAPSAPVGRPSPLPPPLESFTTMISSVSGVLPIPSGATGRRGAVPAAVGGTTASPSTLRASGDLPSLFRTVTAQRTPLGATAPYLRACSAARSSGGSQLGRREGARSPDLGRSGTRPGGLRSFDLNELRPGGCLPRPAPAVAARAAASLECPDNRLQGLAAGAAGGHPVTGAAATDSARNWAPGRRFAPTVLL